MQTKQRKEDNVEQSRAEQIRALPLLITNERNKEEKKKRCEGYK